MILHFIIITFHPLFVPLLNLKTSYCDDAPSLVSRPCPAFRCFQYGKGRNAGWGLGTRLDPPTCFTVVHTGVTVVNDTYMNCQFQVCLNALFSVNPCRLYWQLEVRILFCSLYIGYWVSTSMNKHVCRQVLLVSLNHHMNSGYCLPLHRSHTKSIARTSDRRN